MTEVQIGTLLPQEPLTFNQIATTDWFERMLTKAGVELEPVTGGVIARMVRARLSYREGDRCPVVGGGGVPDRRPGQPRGGRGDGLYELEVRFY